MKRLFFLLLLWMAVLSGSSAQAANPDPNNRLSIGDATTLEGNSRYRELLFPVSLHSPLAFDISASFVTKDITATAGSDYTPYTPQSAGQIVIKAGQTKTHILIRVNGDTREEKDETFLVQLGAPKRVLIADSDGIGTIVDEDYSGQISITDTSFTERNTEQKVAKVVVSLSPSPLHPITVGYKTVDDSAKASQGDYVPTSGSLLFKPGRLDLTVAVPIKGDTTVEADEKCFVRIEAPGYNITKGLGTITIVNDDQMATPTPIPTPTATPALPLSASIDDVVIAEGNRGQNQAQLNITLNRPAPSDVAISYVTQDGTATAGSDYLATSGTLTIKTGAMAAVLFVPTIGDDLDEKDESLTVKLSGSDCIFSKSIGTITLFSDDPPAPLPGTSGKIVFTSDRTGNNEVWIMNADGTGQTRLTTNSCEYSPSFSPDGKKIVYTSVRPDGSKIYLMNADGTGQMSLSSNSDRFADGQPSFSADGQKIIFVSSRGGGSQIWVMNADGSGQTQLSHINSSVNNPSFSPDGSKIVFVSIDSINNISPKICVMNADGTGVVRLTQTNDSETSPHFSPDGRKILFASSTLGRYPQIQLSNPDGTEQTVIANSGGSYRIQPCFSPDGKQLVYVTNSHFTDEIWIMNLDGTGQAFLRTTGHYNNEPNWGPGSVGGFQAAAISQSPSPKTPSAGSS